MTERTIDCEKCKRATAHSVFLTSPDKPFTRIGATCLECGNTIHVPRAGQPEIKTPIAQRALLHGEWILTLHPKGAHRS